MYRTSTTNAHSFNNQWTQHQCTEHQQPMCSASTANVHSIRLPYSWFLQYEDFHSEQYASHPCHSARSRRRSRRIHPPRKYPLPGCVGWSSSKTLLPQGEGFPSLFETVDSATSGKPFVQNDMRVGWEWKKKQFIKVCHYKRHERICSCSILNTWINQKINAFSINQQPMDAVSAAIANSIKINVQSIFKQYTKRQQPMNATSMHRASTTNVLCINSQCA